MSLLFELLQEKQVLILDGALGTVLENRRGPLHPQLWSAEVLVNDPDAVSAVHCEYLRAGADIITTASYQVSYAGLQECFGYSKSQTDAAISFATHLAQKAIQKENLSRKLVASSIGSYGAHLANGGEFYGRYGKTTAELIEYHSALLPAHLAGKPDILAFETVPCIEEVGAIASLLNEAVDPMQALLALSCKSEREVNDGSSIEDVCRKIEDPNSLTTSVSLCNLAVGVNCTRPQYVTSLLSLLRDHLRKDRVLVAYPNRGELFDTVKMCYDSAEGLEAAAFAQAALEWKEVGASVIGSCCRTDPQFTQQLSEVFRKTSKDV